VFSFRVCVSTFIKNKSNNFIIKINKFDCWKIWLEWEFVFVVDFPGMKNNCSVKVLVKIWRSVCLAVGRFNSCCHSVSLWICTIFFNELYFLCSFLSFYKNFNYYHKVEVNLIWKWSISIYFYVLRYFLAKHDIRMV